MKIAWIGTGMMGTPMARLLAHASYEVILWDSDRGKLKKLDQRLVWMWHTPKTLH